VEVPLLLVAPGELEGCLRIGSVELEVVVASLVRDLPESVE
jgi:hypothetical protein